MGDGTPIYRQSFHLSTERGAFASESVSSESLPSEEEVGGMSLCRGCRLAGAWWCVQLQGGRYDSYRSSSGFSKPHLAVCFHSDCSDLGQGNIYYTHAQTYT